MVWGVAIALPTFPSSDGGNDCSAALRCVLKFDLGSRALKKLEVKLNQGLRLSPEFAHLYIQES